MTNEPGRRALPLSPHPDYLRKEAKTYLVEMKTRIATARLADAQFALARDYGFASWGHLMAEVMRRSAMGPRSALAAFWRWRYRQVAEPDTELEAQAGFFRVGVASHVGFFLCAFAGVGLVFLNQEQTHSMQSALKTLALLAKAIL